jgi:hypothetical protein
MENCPVGIAKIVLSHELGHALDDQLYDIDGTLSRVAERSDVGMAYQSVVEGSGTAVMNRWRRRAASPRRPEQHAGRAVGDGARR